MSPLRPKKETLSPSPNTLPFLSFFLDKPLLACLGLAVLVLFFLFGWKIYRENSVWTASGEHADDNFGDKVVCAGDVNGDGYSDIAVWASSYDSNRGKVYLYLGSSKGPSKTPSWTGQGENQTDEYGHSFGTVGDFNRDGFGDFIVASPGYSTPGKLHNGRVYLYLGSPQGLPATPSWTYDGRETGDLLGDCSGRAGDVNHDGLDDAVIGLYGRDYGRGAAYVFYGSKNGFSPQPAWSAEGEGANSWFGYSTASANIKGDGYPSIIIGAKQQPMEKMGFVGKVYVYYGSKDGVSQVPSWTVQGETANSRFGYRALSSGDVRGDGHDGVMVGAPGYMSPDGRFTGKVYVYYGSSEGLPPGPSWTATGEEGPDSHFGYTIASGDFNGDGYSDVAVGAPFHKNSRGKVYVFLGSPGGLSRDPSWTWAGEEEGDQFGGYVANAGDVNGDGIQDLIVGAPGNSGKGKHAGRAYLFYGDKNGRLSPELPLWPKRKVERRLNN